MNAPGPGVLSSQHKVPMQKHSEMPCPSRGCRTCRQRRIKVGGPLEIKTDHHRDARNNFRSRPELTETQCDETRPACNQCTRTRRPCPGYELERVKLQFRNENDFAGGAARKPRKTFGRSIMKLSSQTPSVKPANVDATPSIVSSVAESSLDSVSNEASEDSNQDSGSGGTVVPRSLSISVEVQAFTNFAHKYFITSTSFPLPEIWSHLPNYCSHWESPVQDSMLGLAVNALALATFDRSHPTSGAMETGRPMYTRAIAKVNQGLSDMNQATSDHLILTVLLLINYEVCKRAQTRSSRHA